MHGPPPDWAPTWACSSGCWSPCSFPHLTQHSRQALAEPKNKESEFSINENLLKDSPDLSPMSLFSGDLLLSLIQLSPHSFHATICLKIFVSQQMGKLNPSHLLVLLLVLVGVPALVLQLHQQLLDLLLQLAVRLRRQHPLLRLRGQLLLQVTHLRLQSSWGEIECYFPQNVCQSQVLAAGA